MPYTTILHKHSKMFHDVVEGYVVPILHLIVVILLLAFL